MNRDGTIRCEYQVELPRLEIPQLGAALWGRASGVVTGRADPTRALAAFDAAGQRPYDAVALDILQNIRGWMAWAVGEVYGRWLREGKAAELATGAPPVVAAVRELIAAQFLPWTFQVEGLELKITIDPQAIQALPADLKAKISGTPGVRSIQHQFSGDIPPFTDPRSRNEIKVRCNAQVTFNVNLAKAKAALDPTGRLAPERLEREALTKGEEWFWYGVKQSFYNWIYDVTKAHRRFVREYELIHPDVMALCQDGLTQHGIGVTEALVRYEALDPDSAWALTAPGQSGGAPTVPPGSAPRIAPGAPAGPAAAAGSSGKHQAPAAPPQRGSSDQAMAATIAIMDVNDLPLPGMGKPAPGQPLPPIEESVWRHQKAVMKDNPGLDRSGCAVKILERLKADGYPVEDRKRIATIIGGDPNDVRD